jgi:hypothetical protein
LALKHGDSYFVVETLVLQLVLQLLQDYHQVAHLSKMSIPQFLRQFLLLRDWSQDQPFHSHDHEKALRAEVYFQSLLQHRK